LLLRPRVVETLALAAAIRRTRILVTLTSLLIMSFEAAIAGSAVGILTAALRVRIA
jgi:hypothetical protein